MFSDSLLLSQVPPSDLLVFCCSDDYVGIRRPDNRLDSPLMHAGANLEAGRRVSGEVIDAQLLLHATCCNDLGLRLAREGDGADNVVVSECVQGLACVGVPYFAI